jgi:O-antigen/teichoic acid export membrane protein
MSRHGAMSEGMEEAESERSVTGAGFARLTRDSAVFALGSVAGKAVGVVLVPFLARVLSPADFGRLDVLSSLESTIISALILGLDVAAVRLYFDHGEDERRRLFGTWYAISLLIILPPSVAMVVLSRRFSVLMFGTSHFQLATAAVGITTLGGMFLFLGLTVLRAQGRPGWYASLSAGSLIVYGVATPCLMLGWQRSVGAAMVALALGQCVGACGGLLLLHRYVFGKPSLQLARLLFQLALPLAPAVAGMWIADFANRAILLSIAGATQVGYLSVAVRLSSAAVVVVSGFQLAWQPRAFALGTGPLARQRILADGRRIIVTISSAVITIALLTPEAVRVIAGRAYLKALPAVSFALVAALAMGVYLVVSTPSAVVKAMGDLGRSAGVAVVVTVLANLALASRFGAAGTAAAMALGQVLGVATAVAFARRRDSTLPRWGRAALIAGSAALVALVSGTSPGRGVALRAGMGFAFLALLWREGALGEALRLTGRLRREWRERR